MKKLLLLLLIAPIVGHSQSLEFKQYFAIEPQVVEVDTTSADELYNRLKSWVIKSYNEPNEVIVVDTPKQIRIRPLDSCFMTYKPLLTVICYVVRYQITLEIKDNKYRFSFNVEKVTLDSSPLMGNPSDWLWKKKDGTPRTNGQAKQMRTSANISLNEYFKSIKLAALNPVTSTDDDW
jgi:hypothetical protein